VVHSFTGEAAVEDVFRWIEGFINFERGQISKGFRLDRTQALASLAGNPEKAYPTLHVAGSKGKGSVTTMIASILDAGGLKTGLYVSPHVVDYRERVSLARGPFPEEIYASAGDELKSALDRAVAAEAIDEPTFFELMTTLFFLCCRRAGCGAAAVETGMGGRLDSTNIVDPLVSVLTPIELEHTEYLGNTIAAIAGEKAGIIKRGRPAVAAPQKPEALAVFRKAASERGAPFRYLPEEASVSGIRVDREGTSARIEFADKRLFPAPLDVRLHLVGEIQAGNAALTALASRLAIPDLSDAAVVEGLRRATLPARFERVREDPPAVVDGAHTAASAEIAARTFSALYGDGGVLLFGCAIDKDAAAMAERLAPRFSRVIVTRPGDFKKSDPAAAAEAFRARHGRVELVEDTAEAVGCAFDSAKELGLPLLATGSFYLAAIVRAAAGKMQG
jgi:dihydrofolate synthase/folylpolyglutamate synthase